MYAVSQRHPLLHIPVSGKDSHSMLVSDCMDADPTITKGRL